MMEDEAEELETVESEEQFWEEIDDIASTPCRTHDRIDDTLRTWIALITRYREAYIHSEEHVAKCAAKLVEGSLYQRHAEYVRRQLVYGLLQEDDSTTLHLIVGFLLLDGRREDACYELLAAESGFARLVELVRQGTDDDHGLHRRMLVLIYEMSRIQRIPANDLMTVDDEFVLFLFRIIESLSTDVKDPYHYPTIRVLLVLNEQYMIAPQRPADRSVHAHAMTNRVIKVLSTHGAAYKTFGENIILLLNRESETSLQLLILKIFYLLFTTPSTYEYFYTNDLHVLVDILIRNLLDLPPDIFSTDAPTTTSLRHTYLRVLTPLLAHTQLSNPPHYKRGELRKVLYLLADASHNHFERPDETTVRLVGRVLNVDWLREDEDQQAATLSRSETLSSSEDGVGAGQAAVAKKLLGISMPEGQESSMSVDEVAKQQAKPGVATPSRSRGGDEGGLEATVSRDVDVLSPVSEISSDPFRG